MDNAITIHDLEEPVWQKLRVRAAKNGRSVEAEARDILTNSLLDLTTDADRPVAPVTRADATSSNKGKFDHVIGIWKGGMTTDEVMHQLRGED